MDNVSVLSLTKEQAALLTKEETAKNLAQERIGAMLAAICAGHGLGEGRVTGYDPVALTLTVEVPVKEEA